VIHLPSLTQLDRAAPMRIWLCMEPTDMRRGFDRLAEQALQLTRQHPQSGHLFVFRSRRGDRLKALYWDKDGYVLWYKRLEEGTFKLPKLSAEQASVELKASELAMLLDGIDLASIRRGKRYRRAQGQDG
jgi:transposase